MLCLENITIRQGDFHLSANWSVTAGQKLAIIGPSGGGKSTLLSTIAGFVAPQSGRLCVDGQDITTTAPGARPVSLLFQEHNLFPHLSVAQNVGLGLRPDLRLSRAERDAVQSGLDRVGLNGMSGRYPAALSGGQRQRVALARALLRRKPVLMLDEPFAALGPALKAEMLDLVDEITRDTGATLLMVTHDPEDAKRIADVTSLVSNGITATPVETGELFANPPEMLRSYIGG
jgi:thiamine transport system ATP-binding protein